MIERSPLEAENRGRRTLLSGRFFGGRAAVGFVLVSVWLDVLSLGVIIPVYAPLVQQFQGGDTSSAARWMAKTVAGRSKSILALLSARPP